MGQGAIVTKSHTSSLVLVQVSQGGNLDSFPVCMCVCVRLTKIANRLFTAKDIWCRGGKKVQTWFTGYA